MYRQDFQEISRIRRREARSLFLAKHYPGAYYLVGYSIECALKACIAKRTQRHEFPDKDFAIKVYTHHLERLMDLAGLQQTLKSDTLKDRVFDLNWNVVKNWNEISRYNHQISRGIAQDLYRACASRKHGVLPWIMKRW